MRVLIICGALLTSGCGVGAMVGGDGGGTGGTGGSGGGTGGAGGGTNGYTGLNCDVATMLANRCVSCHSTPPTGGAPYAIASRAELIAMSPAYPTETVAQRSLTRMQATTSPMPPAGYPAPTSTEIAALQSWITAGMPAGSCSTLPGADAGATCASSSYWNRGTDGSRNMLPGSACKACHVSEQPGENYQYMGTVFPNLHEKDSCNAMAPANTWVDILEPNGTLRVSLPVNTTSGNFYGPSLGNPPAPFRARVRTAAGLTTEMQSTQTDGDCNTCHSQTGANGALGRVLYPR